MPRAWSQKDERQYKRILKSCRKTKCERKGKRSTCKLSEKELKACKRIAAATVNKRRTKKPRVRTRGLGATDKTPKQLEAFVREVAPDLLQRHMYRCYALKQCSAVAPSFTHLARQEGFDVRTVHVGNHYYSLVDTKEGVYEVDLTAMQFLAPPEGEPDYYAFVDQMIEQTAKDPLSVVEFRRSTSFDRLPAHDDYAANPEWTAREERFFAAHRARANTKGSGLSRLRLRGLEGALTSGSFAGAPGKIVHRDMSPEKIELGYRRAGRVTKMCPALRFDAGEYDAGVEITAFTVPSREEGGRGQYAGRIDAEIRGGDLQVMFAEIEPELRRCGVGTRLYETLMRIAQKKKLRLVSDSQRSEGAETFWQKQVKKNRAECIDDRGGHKYTPGRDDVEPNVWPCRRFALKRRVRSLRGRRA